LIVDERLAAGDRNARRAALFDGRDAFLEAEPFAQNVGGMLDLSAAGAGEVTLQERFQLEHERVFPLALEFFVEDITADG
jgi:hypothetical protein